MKKKIIITNETKIRLDSFLSEKLNLSRNQCNNLIQSGKILINNKIKKKKYILKKKDLITLNIEKKKQNRNILPINLNLKIIYEDNFLVLLNKPSDLMVHPSPNYKGITLINGLIFRFKELQKIKSNRPGIIHRLDKDTTGLIIIGKNEEIVLKLQNQIKKRKIKRTYWALIHGFLPKEGIIDLPIKRNSKNRLKMSISPEGKPSVTYFKTLKMFNNFSLLELNLETGRTHQIRVHLSYLKTPIVGDPLYGKKDKTIKKQLLHSKKINFIHPITKKEMNFEIPLPSFFEKILSNLEKNIKK
ncbi:MAG: RluA family pseudouridine synthase [Candidatus Phytoplasma cynodontis]|uniref:RluA family pseudouridine synthase n=1 Tax='Cynodon dactylon' phytoplasma TaxID=295320 RepID=UPI001265C2D6|nr:RluA family pseudouridine synthase ['Cynodon dactylon' phytoplasma]KAB8122039.1 RluA family pseudouridine synthase ['Cynodon dactylon' phytoplasma]WIA07544.1 MAG: RluA family pseudouridine synthase [Candidatus Phytoplasma cynodontis]